jgi:hypothetical protein
MKDIYGRPYIVDAAQDRKKRDCHERSNIVLSIHPHPMVDGISLFSKSHPETELRLMGCDQLVRIFLRSGLMRRNPPSRSADASLFATVTVPSYILESVEASTFVPAFCYHNVVFCGVA